MDNTAYARLQAKVNAPRTFEASSLWNPQPGEEIFGTLEKVRQVKTKQGLTQVADIRTVDGNLWNVFLSRSVLASEFVKSGANAGDTVLIKYEGEKESKKTGNSFHLYRVEAEAPEAA